MANKWFHKKEKRKRIYDAGESYSEIDFVLLGKKDRKYVRGIKVIAWKLQHRLVVVDLDKKVLKKIVQKNVS